MAKAGWTYKSNVKKVKQTLLRGTAKGNRDTAKGITKRAKELVPSDDNTGPFATGALQASIHTVDGTPKNLGGGHSGYENARRDALAANPRVGPLIEGPLDLPASPDPGLQHVAVYEPMEYAEGVEAGGFDMSKGYRAPGPHLEPAKEEEKPKHKQRISAAVAAAEKIGL
jgi:hypothetical protein